MLLCRYKPYLLEKDSLQSLKSHLYLTIKWTLFLWFFISDKKLNFLSQFLKSHLNLPGGLLWTDLCLDKESSLENVLLQFSKSHLSFFSSKCDRLCRRKPDLYLNILLQFSKSHLNIFSLKCVRLWKFKPVLHLNSLLQSLKSHLYGFSSKCVRLCWRRFAFKLNFFIAINKITNKLLFIQMTKFVSI